MAKLEVQIGADSSELKKEVEKAVVIIDKLDKKPPIVIKPKVETAELEKSTNKAKEKLSELAASTAQLEKVVISTKPPIVNLGKALDQLSVSTSKVADSNRTSTSTITTTGKHLSTLEKTTDKTGQAFANMQKPVANGGNTLMQFSRIAQDAPYGIMGIGNNITATVEAFGHLKNSTGSAGGALKALAGSIMGSGGILLAVSLVTTAFTYMAQNGLSVGDVIDKMTGKFDANRKAMQDMNAEVVKNSQAQISSMNAYVSVAENVNLSMNDRLIAVKKLQQEYPAYFGNLSNEEILNGNVAGAVRAVTRAIIAKAKAAAAVDRIVKLSEEEERIQSNIKNELAEVARGYQLNKKEAFEFAKAVLEGADAFKLLDPYKKRAGFFDVSNAVALNNTLSKLDNQLISNRTKQDKLTESINDSTAAYIKLESAKPKGVKTGSVGVTPQVSGLGSAITPVGLAETGGKVLQIAKNVQGAEGMITTSMGNIRVAFDTSGQGMLEALQKFNADANALITGSLADTFGQLGTVIGDALANGGNVFAAIGSVLLQSLGKFLSDMGGLLIQYGTMAVIKGKLDLAIATGGPAAIAAGFAAIGVGIALKAIGGAIASKAQGGNSSGGRSVSTGSSVSSPTSSTGGGGGSSFQGGTVVFEISGQSLIGVLSNTLDKNRRLGGSLSF